MSEQWVTSMPAKKVPPEVRQHLGIPGAEAGREEIICIHCHGTEPITGVTVHSPVVYMANGRVVISDDGHLIGMDRSDANMAFIKALTYQGLDISAGGKRFDPEKGFCS